VEWSGVGTLKPLFDTYILMATGTSFIFQINPCIFLTILSNILSFLLFKILLHLINRVVFALVTF
jgi:hypothetical protein